MILITRILYLYPTCVAVRILKILDQEVLIDLKVYLWGLRSSSVYQFCMEEDQSTHSQVNV